MSEQITEGADADSKGTFKKQDFIEKYVFLFVFTFDGYEGMFLFDDMDRVEAIMCYFWRSNVKPNVRLISSIKDVSDVFDKASYTDLTSINQLSFICDVAVNKLKARLDDLGDPNLFLRTMFVMPRSRLNAVHRRRLKQITSWFNKEDDFK